MKHKNNGFINLLFEGSESYTARTQKPQKQIRMHKIDKYVQENAFMPRNRLKNIRIIRISDTIAFNTDNQDIAKHIKKIFLEGSSATEIIPRRYLATQNYHRAMEKNRMYSPEVGLRKQIKCKAEQSKHESMIQSQREDFFPEPKEKSQEGEKNLEESEQFPSFHIMKKDNKKEDYASMDCSTNNSSNKNLRKGTSVRYRKIVSSDRKNKSTLPYQSDAARQIRAKAALEMKKDLVKFYSNPFGNPENITAKAYIVIQHYSKKTMSQGSKMQTAMNSKINLEIASLTKIMTCILTLQICEKHKVDIKKDNITIGSFQTNVQGTSASIQVGQIYTIQSLLYGLMLPSGNDASIALAVFCGQLLLKEKKKPKCLEQACKKTYYKYFIQEMNKKCQILNLKRTFFTNSHGLANNLNRSCASDIAQLIDYALRHKVFRTIVGTKVYECTINQKKVRWENTHLLLHTKPDLYKGIKTGVTDPAGPCLASLVQINGREFIIVVLNSKASKRRYKDTEILRKWMFKKEGIQQSVPE